MFKESENIVEQNDDLNIFTSSAMKKNFGLNIKR